MAVVIAAQTFWALGEGRAASSFPGYLVMLAVVFMPVAFIWCNDGPRLIHRIGEGMGWVVLLLFLVIAVGSM